MRKSTKLKLMILYLVSQGVLFAESSLGESIVRLGNLLYLIDFESYKLTGKTITGVKYHKYKHGAKPDGIEKEIQSLIKTGHLRIVSFAEHLSSVAP